MAKQADEKVTHQVRVFADVGEMISWITRIEQISTAQLLDPILRAAIAARYKKHEELINEMKKAEETMRAVEEKTRQKARENAQAETAKTKKNKPE